VRGQRPKMSACEPTLNSSYLQSAKRNFVALDMLRGIAAIAVVFRHLNHATFEFLPSSGLAVDLFFVLSGFVVAHAYEEKLRTTMSFPSFLKIRLLRLYPMYIAGTLASAVGVTIFTISGVDWDNFAWTLAFAILFLPVFPSLAYGGTHLYPFNFPAWSLCWELAINFFYALVVSRLTNRILGGILFAGIWFLCAAAWFYGDLTGGSSFSNMWAGPLRVVYSFFAGVGAYRIWRAGYLALLRINIFVAMAILLLVFSIRPANDALYDLAATLFVFPVLVLATSDADTGRLRSVSSWLGNVSYPVYAIHAAFLPLEKPFYKYIGGPVSTVGIPGEVAFVAMIVVVAFAAEKLYDAPLRGYVKSRADAATRANSALHNADGPLIGRH